MARLELKLLGSFQVTLDDLPLHAFESDKGRALLAYLAVDNQHPHRRETLAALLWPNQGEACARTNLRQTLHRLHHTLGDLSSQPPFLLASPQEIQFNRESDYHVDVETFSRLLAFFQSHHPPGAWPCEDCLQRLESAVRLYQGNFLSGFSLPNAAQFQWWMLCKQEEYHRLAIQALTDLASYYEKRQDYLCSLHYVRQIIALEPWYEPAHRDCMRLLFLSGQRVAALRQYATCKEILDAEMGIAPSPLTNLLREQIWLGKEGPVEV